MPAQVHCNGGIVSSPQLCAFAAVQNLGAASLPAPQIYAALLPTESTLSSTLRTEIQALRIHSHLPGHWELQPANELVVAS